ncbi:MAG: polysaccharide pyruvyl transferase CsaB [Vampirovibrionales bacterium]|nr:polysaccharide pyruvyl transferase CsaB [Vampirovibrionales bacterium]
MPSSHRDAREWATSSPRPRVVVSGYYGFGNLGDELILKVLVDTLNAKNVAVTVLSNDPSHTARTLGVRAVHRLNLVDIIDALINAHLFVSGGGGLFQDVTGPASAFYYGGLIRLARLFDVPVCFWSQGVGPLTHPVFGGLTRAMTGFALNACEALTVRDHQSADLVENLTAKRPPVTADPVWLLKLPDGGTASESLLQTPQPLVKTIGVSLRPWPELTPPRLEALARLLVSLAVRYQEEGFKVEFLLFAYQYQTDWRLLSEFEAMLSRFAKLAQLTAFHCQILSDRTCTFDPMHPFWTGLHRCSVFFGMRYHSLVLALLAGKPVFGLAYDPKVQSLLTTLKLPGVHVALMEGLRVETVQRDLMTLEFPDLKPFKTQAWANLHLLEEMIHRAMASHR